MTTVNFDPGQQAFPSNLAYQKFLDCLKTGIEVVVTVLPYQEGDFTEIAVRNSQGVVETKCLIEIPGNPLGQQPNQQVSYTPKPGGVSGPTSQFAGAAAAAAGEITSFAFGDHETGIERIVPQFEVLGLAPMAGAELISILTDSLDGYARFVSLLDDDTTVNGSDEDERIEVGAGNDVVIAGAGLDYVHKWKAGDLTYRGGEGFDILDFAANSGFAFPTAFVRDLFIDLGKGAGKSPYGGDLILNGVEAIYTTSHDDTVLGSKRADTIRDDYGGANTFKTKGGADTISLFSAFEGTLVDGGKGKDSLTLTTSGAGGFNPTDGFGRQVLNLSDPTQNLFDFTGVTVRNVESIAVNMTQDFIHLDLIGTGAGETLTINNFFARANSLVKIDGKGGHDTANGGFGKDILLGGRGNDRLNGNDGDDVIRGGAGSDVLTGGRGNDKLIGDNGADVFVFSDGFGRDRLTGYQDGIDKFDFSGHAGVDAFRDLKVRDTAAGVKILDGDGGRIDLVGIDKVDIDKADFLF